jgi:hypothetical protein
MEITIGLHSSKESNLYIGHEAGLSEEALNNFMYALYEIAITVEVDEETGKEKGITLIEYNGKKYELKEL